LTVVHDLLFRPRYIFGHRIADATNRECGRDSLPHR
jgi:hypothetical protein